MLYLIYFENNFYSRTKLEGEMKIEELGSMSQVSRFLSQKCLSGMDYAVIEGKIIKDNPSQINIFGLKIY